MRDATPRGLVAVLAVALLAVFAATDVGAQLSIDPESPDATQAPPAQQPWATQAPPAQSPEQDQGPAAQPANPDERLNVPLSPLYPNR